MKNKINFNFSSEKKPLLILIIVLLCGILISMFIDLPLGKTYNIVGPNSVETLDRKEENYFLLVCENGEEQCEHIKNAISKISTAKHNIYYIDVKEFVVDINNAPADNKTPAVDKFTTFLYSLDIDNLPMIQERDKGRIVRGLSGFYDGEYDAMLSEGQDVTPKIKMLQQKYKDFVETE